jgi:hypothetical protein
MEKRKKVLKTVVREGVTFDNYPTYVDGAYGDSYLMRDEVLAERIARCIPNDLRRAARFDCALIKAFQEEVPDESPTEQEKQVLQWLEATFPEWAEENKKNE